MSEKLSKLKTVLELLQNDTVKPSDLKDFIDAIGLILKESKDTFKELSDKNLTILENTIEEIAITHEKLLNEVTDNKKSIQKDALQITKSLIEVKTCIAELQNIKYEDGKTPEKGVDYFTKQDIEDVVSMVVEKIPDTEFDTSQIIPAINAAPLTSEYQIAWERIKDAPEFKQGKANGGGWRNLFQLHDVNITDPQNNQVLKYNSTTQQWENGTGGSGGGTWGSITGTLSDQTDLQNALNAKQDTLVSGTNIKTINGSSLLGSGDLTVSASAGGSDTQLQYNNAGAFGGILGATTNGTSVTLTSPTIATSLIASYAIASTIGIFDSSKNLISADTATYPSLTELSYVKGVTSPIQAQLDAKVSSQWTLSSGQLYPTTTTNKVGIGQASATYWLDVLNSTTGMTAGSRTINASLTGGTYNTTAGVISSYAGYFNSNATRASGANALTNIGIYANATGAQNNYAGIFENGSVGIGTTTPTTAKLQIESPVGELQTMGASILLNQKWLGVNSVGLRMYQTPDAGNRETGRVFMNLWNGSSATLGVTMEFSTLQRSTLALTTRMVIDNLGQVGIGTTSGVDATSKLEVRTDALGVTQTTSSGLALTNTTAAANGAQQISPALRFSGLGFGTTAGTSQAVDFRQYMLPVQSTVPTGTLIWESAIAGGAYSAKWGLTSDGSMYVQNGAGLIQLRMNAADTSVGTAGTQALTFYTSPSGSRLNVMYLNTDGTVGIGSGTNAPSSKLEVRTNALGTSQTTSSGLALTNTTAAAAGAQQISSALRWSGKGWKTDATAASQSVDFRSYVVPVQGTANPSGYLTFESSINGAAYAERMRIDSAGLFDVAAYSVGGVAGATGTFTTVDLKTVTVTNGIIVSIV